MKKNTYLIILTIVTIVCIIVGSGMHLMNWNSDNSFSFLSRAKHYEEGASPNTPGKSETITQDFNQIQADLDIMDLHIVKGTDANLTFRSNPEIETKWEVKDGVLTITEPDHKMKTFQYYSATLTIPEQQTLESVDIKTADSDISLNGLTIGKLEVENTDGDCSLSDCTVDQYSSKNSDGDIALRNCEVNRLAVDTYDGDISLKQCKTGSINSKTYDGDISLLSTSFDSADTSTYDGDICIQSSSDLSKYHLNLNTEDGDITVNRKTYSGGYQQTGTSKNTVTADTSSGDIKISY